MDVEDRSDDKTLIQSSDRFLRQRKLLVEEYIRPLEVDQRVIRAFLEVPRHLFVSLEYRSEAYLDGPLPIGWGQVITQPSLVARMTEALKLKGNEKVLEVGTGSGYQSAILSHLAKEVYSVEIIKSLGVKARSRLKRLGYANVHVYIGNGTAGLPKHAPFDAIVVTAGGPRTPEPLIRQLREGGRLVIPLGENALSHELMVGQKTGGKLKFEPLGPVRFVPLVGQYA